MTKHLFCQFTVLGEPKAQKRHRHVNRGKFVSTYDPSKDEKADFRIVAQQTAPAQPIDKPMFVEMEFFFSRPKSHYGTGRNEGIIKGSSPDFHTKKPDSDNCVKFIFDSLNGIFWLDDSMICGHSVMKHYDQKPRTEVRVYLLQKEDGLL